MQDIVVSDCRSVSGCFCFLVYLLDQQFCGVSWLSVKAPSVRMRQKQLLPELQRVMKGLNKSIAQPGCRSPDCGTQRFGPIGPRGSVIIHLIGIIT